MGAVGLAFDLQDDGAIDQPVEERHGQRRIAQVFTSGFEVDVGHQSRAHLLAARVHDLVQQTGRLRRFTAFDAVEAELVDLEQRKAGIIADTLGQGPISQTGRQIL